MSDRSVIWGTKMNEKGFMGMVDKTWILMQRITTICFIVSIFLLVILIILIHIARTYDALAREQFTTMSLNRSRLTPYPYNQNIR